MIVAGTRLSWASSPQKLGFADFRAKALLSQFESKQLSPKNFPGVFFVSLKIPYDLLYAHRDVISNIAFGFLFSLLVFLIFTVVQFGFGI